MVEKVKGWVEEYRKIKNILKEINSMSEQIIRQHVQVKRAVAREQKAPEPVSVDMVSGNQLEFIQREKA